MVKPTLFSNFLWDACENLFKQPSGISVPFPLEPNVEAVFVNPYAEAWYFGVVKGLVRSLKPTLEDRVQKSDLASPPNY